MFRKRYSPATHFALERRNRVATRKPEIEIQAPLYKVCANGIRQLIGIGRPVLSTKDLCEMGECCTYAVEGY